MSYTIVIVLLVICIMIQVMQMMNTSEHYRTGCKPNETSTWCVCSPYDECPGGWKNCGECPPGIADNKTWTLPPILSQQEQRSPDKCYNVGCSGIPLTITSFNHTNGQIVNGMCTDGMRFSDEDIFEMLGKPCK